MTASAKALKRKLRVVFKEQQEQRAEGKNGEMKEGKWWGEKGS